MFLRLLLLAAVVAVGLAVNITIDDCPHSLPRPYLRVFRHSCYLFVLDHERDFDSSERECKSMGSHLVIIRDLDTQNFLYNTIRNEFDYGGTTWIGLSDLRNEDHFIWVDGSPATFEYWATGQPGFMGGLEDCAAMVMSEGGKWHDFRCRDFFFIHNRQTFVCEYIAVNTTQSPTTADNPLQPAITTSSGSVGSTECPPFKCPLDCGLGGYKVNGNGCLLCQCEV